MIKEGVSKLYILLQYVTVGVGSKPTRIHKAIIWVGLEPTPTAKG